MKCLIVVLLSLVCVLADDEPGLEEFINSNQMLTVSLYKEIVRNSEANFVISPFSTGTVLALAQSGCKGETAQEIRNNLHLPHDNDRLEYGTKESTTVLKGSDRYTLHIGNILYVANGFTINEEFKKSATEIYGAEVKSIEFASHQKAAKTMNEWLEKQSRNGTKNLISPLLLNDHIKAVLINIAYFKGNWTKPFSKFTTKPIDFYKTRHDIVRVDTMHLYRAWFNYYENSEIDARFLEVPFEGEDVSMVIVLPNKKVGLAALEKDMRKVFAPQNLKQEFVNVALPKFKIGTTLNIVQILKNLGIKKIFDGNEADLSGIAGDKSELVISTLLQTTFIDVKEDGAEATAAPFVPLADNHLLKGGVPEPKSKDFIADHPFVFYIKAKNFIIFTGRVFDPQI